MTTLITSRCLRHVIDLTVNWLWAAWWITIIYIITYQIPRLYQRTWKTHVDIIFKIHFSYPNICKTYFCSTTLSIGDVNDHLVDSCIYPVEHFHKYPTSPSVVALVAIQMPTFNTSHGKLVIQISLSFSVRLFQMINNDCVYTWYCSYRTQSGNCSNVITYLTWPTAKASIIGLPANGFGCYLSRYCILRHHVSKRSLKDFVGTIFILTQKGAVTVGII